MRGTASRPRSSAAAHKPAGAGHHPVCRHTTGGRGGDHLSSAPSRATTRVGVPVYLILYTVVPDSTTGGTGAAPVAGAVSSAGDGASSLPHDQLNERKFWSSSLVAELFRNSPARRGNSKPGGGVDRAWSGSTPSPLPPDCRTLGEPPDSEVDLRCTAGNGVGDGSCEPHARGRTDWERAVRTFCRWPAE